MNVVTKSPSEVASSPLDILLVEDERAVAEPLSEVLDEEGHRVTLVMDGSDAMDWLGRRAFDLAICDIRLPNVDGLTIFRRLRSVAPQTEVILMSAYGTVAEAVNAMKEQAAHYLAKPFDVSDLLGAVHQIAERKELSRNLTAANAELAERDWQDRDAIVGGSPAIQALKHKIATIAQSDGAIIITGESGTGKELVARSIHRSSRRAERNFVAVNCAAFPETLLEAELFGYERGAFTGANRRREGRFQAAHGGTLFLDEIAEMSSGAQAKLLRVLENGTFQPLGTNQTERVDVRVISATNVDLADRVEKGLFREDLYYRLKVFQVKMPSLRERQADLPVLVQHLYRRFLNDPTVDLQISPRAWAALSSYHFPGNVRELKNLVEHAVTFAQGSQVDLQHLPEEIAGRGSGAVAGTTEEGAPLEAAAEDRSLAAAVRGFEREYLLHVLRECGWHKGRTAQRLQISRKTLWQKLVLYGLSKKK